MLFLAGNPWLWTVKVASSISVLGNQLLNKQPHERPNIVMIETWNELHEGTDICETREYGRQYIDMTAKYSVMFKER